jgi:hypothetical protein
MVFDDRCVKDCARRVRVVNLTAPAVRFNIEASPDPPGAERNTRVDLCGVPLESVVARLVTRPSRTDDARAQVLRRLAD